jgi:hypothetical protein
MLQNVFLYFQTLSNGNLKNEMRILQGPKRNYLVREWVINLGQAKHGSTQSNRRIEQEN